MRHGPDPFHVGLDAADALEGAARWETLVRQRDKLSARLSYVNDLPDDDPERAELAPRVTASRLRFEDLLRDLAAWAGVGVGVGDVAGVLAESDEASGLSTGG